MEDSQLRELEQARNQLVDQLIDSTLDSDAHKVLELILAVDDVVSAFDVDTNN